MSNQDRAIAIGLLEVNTPVKVVAQRMGVTPKAIRKLRTKIEGTGQVMDRPRNGRPKVTSDREDHSMRLMAQRHQAMRGMLLMHS